MQAVLAVGSGFVWQILAGKPGFSEMILFLCAIKKIDWTVGQPTISLASWPPALC
jgi:hypothetical protein